jgi:opacity protein-like surface antigen
MNKAFAVALALLPASAAAEDLADVRAGAVEVLGGASLRLSSASGKVKMDQPAPNEYTTSSDDYAFELAALYYVARDVGVGLAATWEYEQQSTEGIPKQGGGNVSLQERTRIWTVGPAVSAQLPVAASLALFARGTLAYAVARTSGLDTPTLKGSGYGFAVGGGLKYFPLAQVSLDAGLTYSYLRLKTDAIADDPQYGSFPATTATSSGLTISAGLSVYFGR